METSRAGRRRLASSVAVLLFAATFVVFLVGDEDEARGPVSTEAPAWPKDLSRACARLAPDDGPVVEDFYAASPRTTASARNDHAAVVLLASADGRQFATCQGWREPELALSTQVYPLRDLPRGHQTAPFGVSSSSYDETTHVAVVVADRLPEGASRVVLWTTDGQKVSLAPKESRWIAGVVGVAPSTETAPVSRFRYMSADGRVLGEWVAPGVQRNPRVPPIADVPGLDQRAASCLSC